MNFPERLAGQAVFRVRFHGPAERFQRRRVLPDPREAHAPERMFEYAQARLNPAGIDPVNRCRQNERQKRDARTEFHQPDPDRQRGTPRRHLDFAFLRRADKGQQIKERHAEQKKQPEHPAMDFEIRPGVERDERGGDHRGRSAECREPAH